jgi:hypothetical protein
MHGVQGPQGDMDLEKDEDMVKYFREVLKRRMKE